MKIKLSDFILENSVNESDIIDIEFESLRAKIDVCCEMANYYEKLLNTQMIQEAMPAQQPPTVPTAQDLQQPSSGYTQDIDTDMPAGYKSAQSTNNYETYSDSVRHVFQDLLSNIKDLTKSGGNIYGFITFDRPNQTDTYCFFYRPDANLIGVYLYTNDVDDNYVLDHNNPYFVSASQKAIKHKLDIGGDIRSQVTEFIQDTINNIKKYYSNTDTQQQETQQPQEQQQSQPQQTQQPQTQQQQPASALSGAIASMLVAVGLFAAKFLDYLKRHADTNLNLAHIKEAITASRKYIDLIYTMALNENFNDNDFNEFIKQFRDMMRIVENAASNAANNSAGQTFTQNARGLLNSEEVKSIESKIHQIQDARFQSQLQSKLSGLSPQNLQMLNSDAQKFKTDMTDLITSATNDIKSASYQQFKPAQQTQTSYQPQQQQATPAPNTQQQQGGQLAQMQ